MIFVTVALTGLFTCWKRQSLPEFRSEPPLKPGVTTSASASARQPADPKTSKATKQPDKETPDQNEAELPPLTEDLIPSPAQGGSSAPVGITPPSSTPSPEQDALRPRAGSAATPGVAPAGPEATPSPARPAPTGPRGTWHLTFEDDFEGLLLDPTRWTTGFGFGAYDSNAWVASCTVPAMVQLRNGRLILGTSSQPPRSAACMQSGKTHSAAAVNTKGLFSQEYGYFEARVRMPGFRGLLGAWWLHRADGQWPPEIDIAEVLGGRPEEHQMAIHYSRPNQLGSQSTGRRSTTTNLSLDFHIYGVEWAPDQIIFYRDGLIQGRIGPLEGAAAQRRPSYLILNTTVCTSAARYWCEVPDQLTPWGLTGTSMEVDWVRVWSPGPL